MLSIGFCTQPSLFLHQGPLDVHRSIGKLSSFSAKHHGYVHKLFDETPARDVGACGFPIQYMQGSHVCETEEDRRVVLAEEWDFCNLSGRNIDRNSAYWDNIIAGYVKNSEFQEAICVFLSMLSTGIMPNRLTLCSIIGMSTQLGSLNLGRQLHGLLVKIDLDDDNFVGGSLVGLYTKFREINDAERLFYALIDADVVAWNCLISGYITNECFSEALKLLVQMQQGGICPNNFTLSMALSACGSISAIEEGKQVHTHVIKAKSLYQAAVANSLLTMYCKCGKLKYAEVLFGEMPKKNVVSWTAIVSGHYQNGFFKEALKQFDLMCQSSVKPNEFTFAIALSCSSNLNSANDGKKIHAQAVKSGLASSVYVGTALVDMYSKAAEMRDAEKQFEEIRFKTDASWNSLMSGFVHNGQHEKAMEFFNIMLKECMMCDEFTYSIVLEACSCLSWLRSGKQVHSLTIKTGHFRDLRVRTAAVEMYGNCGSLMDAKVAFDTLRERDTMSWNAIIKCYSQHGLTSTAFSLFTKMVLEDVRPNGCTFLALLSACSHSGLLEEGLNCFTSMVENYGIRPEATHYSCVVDLLARAGHLQEAKKFIEDLPVKSSACVWRPLLAACRCHGDVEMAEFVAARILETDAGDATAYVTLSNVYAAVGRWEEAKTKRKLMKHQKVRKEPGCSWIEVNGKMYRFFARQKMNLETESVYRKLNELVNQMKEIGYIPDTSIALHDVENERKEEYILQHSEKLAVAFGLVSLPGAGPIRIFKNLTICKDCHNFMKFISTITRRDVIVGDNYRFHYFKHGLCSCGDYW
ncbi:pentatricopeptide repeat-containing protein At3g24000, mitochondrial-like [Nymphaea colorata]|uniref:DYW domain-containing protein n=1 Tax=Nymphaea colorata TaxID=210225 RepID=A0A5K1EEU3_9MAGN|nr:pentatricopeptide repeat-containing protein At3g24000, mitochondrial-like [Nymphaea colorata]